MEERKIVIDWYLIFIEYDFDIEILEKIISQTEQTEHKKESS